MKKIKKALSIILAVYLLFPILDDSALIQPASASGEIELYASPSGNGNQCTLAAPCSLEGARDLSRTLLNAMDKDVNIVLRGGTYERTSTFTLTSADSGRNGYRVYYKAYAGETPVISGGKTITGWALYDADANIYRAAVDAGLDTRQIYVNGERAQKARGKPPAGMTLKADGHTTPNLDMQHWRNTDRIEFVYRNNWQEGVCRVQSIVGGDIKMNPSCWSRVTSSTGLPYEIANAFELLDAPGEWYLDKEEHYLYYKPRAGENMATASVVVPVLERLVSVSGTYDQPLRNVTFEGIVFAYSTWLEPSGPFGFKESQANLMYPTDFEAQLPEDLVKIPAAVSVQAAEAVRFERNVFTHMGAGGLNIDMGRNNAIQGNILSDISGNGLMLGDVKAEDHHPSVPDRLVKDNRIENNVVTRAAQEYHGGVGIWVGYTENTLIAHNEVFDLPYSGISIGWGWGSVDSTDNPSASKDNKIIANHVHHLMQEMVDGGGIYSLGMQRNMLIQGNVVHDQLYDFGAYYLDDGSRYVTLDSNIAYGNKRNLIAKGSNHTIRGNYWDNESSNMNQYTNSTVENNQVTMPGQFPLAILNKAGLTAAYADLLDQVETSDESNVAAGKPAYAYDGTGGTLSSTEVDAGRATDKDLSTDTGVYGGSGPWALAVDLERSHLADAIVVSFPAGGVPSSFKVEIAGLDGIWETVASNATGHTGRNIVPMDGKRIRTVRVTAVSGSMAIAEVEVYKKNASVPLNKGFSIAVISSDNVASDSPSVVSIDGQHNVTGLADGAAVISHAGGDWQFKVDVAPFSNVALYAENTKVASGRSVQVFLKGTTTEGLNVPFDLQQIDFTSDNETKLSVDASGLVSAHGPGSANITASTAQEGAPIIRSLPFLAFEEAVDFVGVQVSVPYLHPAETAQISISELKYDSGYPVELADVDSIQYTSLNPDIATVNTTGLITALQPGQATFAVKVTVNGKQAETEVKLSVFPAGWAYANVNNAEGAAEFDGDSWRIQNKGSDIFGTADQFGFVYKAIDMNQYPQGVAITTTIQSLEDVHNATMTGLMMRSTLDPGSKNVNYRMHASQGLELKYMPFTWRTADNQATDYFYADNLPLPAKIRLIYADQIATAQYWDVTNSQWKTAGAVPIELGASFYVGAAHTSHDLERFSTTEISGISISDAENLPIRISADTNLLTTNATLSLYTAGKGVNETIRYTSDNEGVATVDQNGTVTAVATGKAVIKAQAMSGAVELPGRSDSIVVYVYDEPEQLHSVNKALNKPAAAMTSNLRGLLSTHPGAQETNGNDGNPNTGTQANGQYDWAYRVDLGGLQSVDRMAVTFNAGSFATQFEFLISRDGIDWEVMDSFNNTVGGTTYSTFFEETRMARYAVVRAIRPNGPAQPGSQMNVSEFEVFGQVVPADVSGVSLNRTNIVLGNGGTTKLTATVTPAGANPGVTWSSSDESVVTVDANGKLTAHAPGTATVTAASQENASLSATSTVSVREITNVALNQPSKGLTADLLQDADAGTPFANGNDGKMDTYAVPTGVWNWALRVDLGSVKDIGGMAVTFDPGGYATAFDFLVSTNGTDWEVVDSFSGTTGVGYVQYRTDLETLKSARYAAVRSITPNGPAQPGGQMVVTEFEVYELAPSIAEGVSLNRTNIVLGNGGTTKLTATVTPAGANPGITWSSSDESVVTVDANGKLTAHAPGTATVTAASQENASLSATSTVSVREITNVALNQPSKGLTADLLQDADAGTPFANGNDGKMDTYAVPTGVWNWALRVDLGSVKDIGGMAVTFDPGGYATAFDFLVSTNGTDWEVVDSFSGTTGVGYVQYRTDLETLKSARYAAVRSITPNGPAQPGGQMVVTEFEVYELASPEVLTPSSPTLTGLDITPDPVSLMAGLSQALTVKAKYSDNNETDVTGSAIYSTDNSSIATVSSAGNVASVAAGTTSVTAAFGGKTKTVQVTVTSGNNGTGNGSNGTETGNGSNGTGTGSSGTSGGNGSGSGLQPTPTRPVFNDKVDPDVVRSIVARGKNASAVTFTDVAPSSWSAAVIENAARMGIVSGFANGAFKPDANVTRAEFATMLVRAFGLAPAGSALFKDTQGHWAANAIAALNDLGIISGYGDGTFRPDQPISRAEIVVMLARLTNYVPATTSQFSDVESNWAADAIGAFAAAGIVSGKGEGKFAPASSATRAESVAILVRLLEKLLVQE